MAKTSKTTMSGEYLESNYKNMFLCNNCHAKGRVFIVNVLFLSSLFMCWGGLWWIFYSYFSIDGQDMESTTKWYKRDYKEINRFGVLQKKTTKKSYCLSLYLLSIIQVVKRKVGGYANLALIHRYLMSISQGLWIIRIFTITEKPYWLRGIWYIKLEAIYSSDLNIFKAFWAIICTCHT